MTSRSPAPVLSEDTRRLLGLSERLEETGHVCGNCRNPWSKTGREDCPRNQMSKQGSK